MTRALVVDASAAVDAVLAAERPSEIRELLFAAQGLFHGTVADGFDGKQTVGVVADHDERALSRETL